MFRSDCWYKVHKLTPNNVGDKFTNYVTPLSFSVSKKWKRNVKKSRYLGKHSAVLAEYNSAGMDCK